MNQSVSILQPSYDREFMGDCWYLAHVNELKLHRFLQCVRQIEWEHNIQRVRASHVLRCREGETAHFIAKDGESFRLRGDLWSDTIEEAAWHVLKSHRDLPLVLSCLDDVYRVQQGALKKDLKWTVCAYGVTPDRMVCAASEVAGSPAIRSEVSRVKVHMADNSRAAVPATVLEWTLIAGE